MAPHRRTFAAVVNEARRFKRAKKVSAFKNFYPFGP